MSKRPTLLLLLEAGATIAAASLAIRLLPFRRLAHALCGPVAKRQGSAEDIVALSRAIRAWSRRLPWRTMCFEEGLSAHWMLRRRGLASTLHYGAATIGGELKAHVWVRSGHADVMGCDNAQQFAVLARFPAA